MSGIYISDERGLKLIYGNKTARGNILKEIEDASLEDDQGEGPQSIIDVSIPPDAPLNETAENQIIYLDNHFWHVFLGRPSARCLTRQKAHFRIRGSFFLGGGKEMSAFPHVFLCFLPAAPPPSHLPITTASLHRLSLTLIPPCFLSSQIYSCVH